ncbi:MULTISPECIES: MlaD family protein [Chryseobacterium]|uniref:Virulence factor Mce family protein n=2 Tax=Chryseobacterium gleum TaxID=250 RepID=A0A3S4QV43_CHRGE|nr:MULTISPECIES: MlaD family protein [Chryseobacterium]ASE61623.1 MCE family protein [Chryseobacterium indologenes]AZB32318.1 MCE family protein [Chryseobacterium bernardetii]EFK34077.1 hypothetical protein HMPREF0204_13146 [Chryseobacterium gleum ATCC 35910]MDG4652964.1 MlaD family protein [Chryseobacterium arthrosphaerae]PZU89781.1 MAG: MCE family protein [Chryseobacterium sp.]
MNKNNIKLGLFVISGFILMMAVFFYIGSGSGIFTSKFELRARFKNSNGLREGSNVLFSGMQAGSVKSVKLSGRDDIEVIMLIDKDIAKHIDNNAKASIGTEGIIGNAVVNILPYGRPGRPVQEKEYLTADTKPGVDEILNTLSASNNNIQDISKSLKNTVHKIDSSQILKLINDKAFAENLKLSILKIRQSTENIENLSSTAEAIITSTRQGKGATGLLLANKDFESQLKQTFNNVNAASNNLNTVSNELIIVGKNLQAFSKNIENGKGPINALITDTVLTKNINNSLYNIEKGTEGFNQNMEALKHNFLFRGYFRKQEKKKKEAEKQNLQR